MERLYYSAKSYLAHFQLYYCCWFAPVRVGLFIIGYFNLAVDLLYMVQIANDGLEPTILSVQNALIPDYVSKPVPVAAYAIEFAFNVVLICGLYRRDIALIRVFLYYTIFAVVMSIMTYSMVLAAVSLHIQLAIIFSTVFQMYCILLVRSEIVNMKMERKKYELPRLVMSSLPSPTYNYPKNGQIHEVTITELPKQQEVEIAMIGPGEEIKDTKVFEIKKEPKDTEIKKDPNVVVIKKDETAKVETDPKKVEPKKEVEVKVEIGSIEKSDEKNQEEKGKETKLSKEEKKKEEKRIKEEKKKEEKRLKEEKKKEDKKNREDKKDKEQETTKDLKKEVKEKWLQTVTENPKE